MEKANKRWFYFLYSDWQGIYIYFKKKLQKYLNWTSGAKLSEAR